MTNKTELRVVTVIVLVVTTAFAEIVFSYASEYAKSSYVVSAF